MRTVPDILTSERVAVFIDYPDTLQTLRRAGRQIDLTALRDYLAEGRHLVEAFVYIGPGNPAGGQPPLDRLQERGFLVRSRPPSPQGNGRLQEEFTLELALDVQEFAARARPDIVVLVSGDGDLAPLAQRLRLHGVRVEVASTPGDVAPGLRALANGFVDLTEIARPIEHLPLPDEQPLVPEAGFAGEDELLAARRDVPGAERLSQGILA